MMRSRSNISLFDVSNHGIMLFGMVFAAILLSSCSATKFLKTGETFYTGAEIKIIPQGDITGQKRIITSLENLITPKPNARLLGMRPSVWFYYKAGNVTKKSGIRYFVQTKLGSPPVLLKDATPSKTVALLTAQLNNDGYFKSTVESQVQTSGKNSKLVYTVMLQPPFRLRKINYNHTFDTTSQLGLQIKNDRLVKTNQRFKLERLQAEQQRIEGVAENNGMYYFDNRYLLFDADTTVGKRRIDLDLLFEKGMPAQNIRRYKVSEINVFPSYSLENDTLKVTADTVKINGYTYIDNQHEFRPEIITDVINLKKDSLYRQINREYSLVHLMGLQTFKYVSIKFSDSKKDSAALIANIYMTPLKRNSIRMQFEGVSKSNNFVGPGFQFTFTNRNFFRGAELFQLKLHSAYEVQINSLTASPLNSFEAGADVSIGVPRFITPRPIHIRYGSAKYLPQTVFKLGYNYQERLSYFSLTSFNASIGYIWRETTLKTHELYPIDITYIKSGDRSKVFDSLLNHNPILKNSFQNQFILGTRYSFTINTQFTEDTEEKYRLKERKKSNFYFRGTIDISGNTVNALQQVAEKSDSTRKFLGSPYSQYLRGDIDFRYFLQLGRESKLATRLIVGVGNAYGNSSEMPYIKQFSIGGSNSIRAFPARSLGPGTYNVRSDTTISKGNYIIDQRGDIKLEGNIEYRFGLIKALKGAVFVDAGNIWLWKGDKSRPGSEFYNDQFIKQIAVGTGFGIRYDFSYFVLRFDLAFPLRKVVTIGKENQYQWVTNQIDFGSARWRSDNLVLNIAIGYPF